MDIKYRIIEKNEDEHSIVVRYWTDIISELDLVTEYDANGNPILTSNGWPVRCRTDSNLNLYDLPNPSEEELIDFIEKNAPADWLVMKHNIASGNVSYSLNSTNNIFGQERSFLYVKPEPVVDMIPQP